MRLIEGIRGSQILDDTYNAAPAAMRAALAPMIQKGDLVLVKGSQGVRMEKVVEMLMAHPEDAPKLLVRQEHSWK